MIFLSYKYLSKKNSTEQSKVVKYRSFFFTQKQNDKVDLEIKTQTLLFLLLLLIDHPKNGGVII